MRASEQTNGFARAHENEAGAPQRGQPCPRRMWAAPDDASATQEAGAAQAECGRDPGSHERARGIAALTGFHERVQRKRKRTPHGTHGSSLYTAAPRRVAAVGL